jgi:hypothetical protein
MLSKKSGLLNNDGKTGDLVLGTNYSKSSQAQKQIDLKGECLKINQIE